MIYMCIYKWGRGYYYNLFANSSSYSSTKFVIVKKHIEQVNLRSFMNFANKPYFIELLSY